MISEDTFIEMVNEARATVKDAEEKGRDVTRMREFRFLGEEGGRFRKEVRKPDGRDGRTTAASLTLASLVAGAVQEVPVLGGGEEGERDGRAGRAKRDRRADRDCRRLTCLPCTSNV